MAKGRDSGDVNGASGNRLGDGSFTYSGDGSMPHTNAYTDGWQSSAPSSDAAGDVGGETGEAANSVKESAKETASNVGDSLGNAAGSIGYTFIAGAMTGARNGADMLKRMGRRVLNALMPMGGGIATLAGGVISQKTGAIVAGGGMVMAGMVGGGVAIETLFGTPYQVEYAPKCPEVLPVGGPKSFDGEFEDMEEAAEYIYQALSGMGITDENIAGMLGNWQIESGIDPTSVETIFDEPFEIGPKKQRAVDADFDIKKIDAAYAAKYPTIKQAGVGLGGWTNDRNVKLMDFAEDKNGEWHSMDIQLAFSFSKEEPPQIQKYMREIVEGKNKGAHSVEAATTEFYTRWEGIANTSDVSLPKRQEAAAKWYAKMGGWSADTALGKSILAMADSGMKAAGRSAQRIAVMPGCEPPTDQNLNNSDAARALAQYVWPKQSKGDNYQNDGTDLYMYVHDQVFEGDIYYASCDRTVGTAVRWSGTDKDIVAGPVSDVYKYFMGAGKDKWEMVGKDLKEEQLEPGDVLIAGDQNHVWMYLSEEIVDEVWKGKDYDKGAKTGSGSLNDRSPTLAMGIDESKPSYFVFRNTKKDPDKKMVDMKIPPEAKPDHCGDYKPCALTTPPP